ncbi:hypothetical protein MHBO_001430 [Bonamia ostreae]|uniref:Protein kinase domain-containing protein n=1 Tax=Bonamia ostreae TaxID=126728 RepID=A0ABV2AJJ2_9EUKA
MDNYTLIKTISTKGKTAIIKVRRVEDDEIYCIKIQKIQNRKYIEKEITILKQIDHPFIIKMKNAFIENENIYVVLEYCENGNLKNYLNNVKTSQTKLHLKQLMSSIYYLHSKCVVHRDLKPENILVTANNEIKLADFDSSTILSHRNQKITAYAGTSIYMSPEMMNRKLYGIDVDWWGVGMVGYFMATRKHPFLSHLRKSSEEIKYRTNFLTPSFPSHLSEKMIWLLNCFLKKQPENRLSLDRMFSEDDESLPQFLKMI